MNGTPERVMSGDVPIASPSIGTEKRCIKCKEIKPLGEFCLCLTSKDGYKNQCKACKGVYDRKRREELREELREAGRRWRETHREKCKEYGEKWRLANKERKQESDRRWRENNKKRLKEYFRKRYLVNKERDKDFVRKQYLAYKEKIIARTKKWRENNPEKAREQGRRKQQKILSTPKGRLNCNMSRGITHSLKEGSKAGRHWETLVDFTAEELSKHIEKRFEDGMSWDNYGEWHVDHIIPKAVFNFETPEDFDFKRCWALKNLQPMWAKKNIQKNNRLEKPFQPALLLSV